MPVELLKFPAQNVGDIPRGLRELAEQIEKGQFGDAHTLAWVIDCGDANIQLGLLGSCSEPGPVGYHLYGMAMRKLDCLDG